MKPIDRRALRLVIALTVVCAAWFAAQAAFGRFLPVALEWAVLGLGQTLLVGICWRAGTSPAVPVAAARYWRTTTYALLVMDAGLVIRLADALFGFPWATAAGVVQAAGGVTILAGLARLPIAVRARSDRRGLWLDLAITLGAAAIFGWHAIINGPPIGHAVGITGLLVVITLMGIALVGVFVAKVVLTGSDVLPRGVPQLVGLGYLFGGVGSAVGVMFGDRPGINPFLLIMPCAGLATVLGARRQLQDVAAARAATGRRPKYSLLPYAAVAAVCGLLIYVMIRADDDRLGVALGTALVTALVVVRQILAFRDNEVLVTRLDSSLLKLQREEERFRLLVQNSTDIVMVAELDSTVRYVSPAMRHLLGHDPAAIEGRRFGGLGHPDDAASLRAAIGELTRTPGATTTFPTRVKHADGSWRWFEMIASNFAHEPSIGGLVINARDITETLAVRDKLSFEASHDVLTGLANRALFGERVALSVADPRPGHRLSLVLIDLDDFKIVNDTLGHAAGDALLVAVADRMRASVRPGDTVARLGGDEFAILFEGLSGDDVDRVLVRIAEALLIPVPVEEQLLSVRASFGVVDGQGGDDAGDLLRRADIAMYEAKEPGVGGHQRYVPGMEARGAERSRLNSALREALDRDELLVHFQPMVSLPDGRLIGAEALLRWQHPVRGLLEPADFLSGAEQNGLIVPIGHWVLRTVGRQIAAWRAEHGAAAPGSVSMNVSLRELQEPGFAAEVASVLQSNGLPAQALTIEVTEITAGTPGAAQHTLQELHTLGVRLALDHFGTGASTLSLLATCPVDQIKLDRSFSTGPSFGTGSGALARAVVQLARALEVEAVAAGVETAEQADRLHDLGYRLAQGFHFARPAAAPELAGRFTKRPESLSSPS